jgi:DNA-binding transcriptional ArsR family regulator
MFTTTERAPPADYDEVVPVDAPTDSPADDGPADDGWVPVAGVDGPDERLDLDDLGLLADVTHPVRGKLLRRLKHPRTVAELAALLDVPVTRLYHHVNRLEQLGLVRVVATRRVGAVTERRYQVAARSIGVSHELVETSDAGEMADAMGSLFDVAKVGLQREIESGAHLGLARLDLDSTLSLAELRLSPDRRRELIARLEDIIGDFSSDAADDEPAGETMILFIAAYPQSD